ncbi:MAG TPA: hypothetical protein VFF03_10160 [Rhodocyclaceae bacterium]|nr:hypothetical protein [Rhodocyclaceae bacterium]
MSEILKLNKALWFSFKMVLVIVTCMTWLLTDDYARLPEIKRGSSTFAILFICFIPGLCAGLSPRFQFVRGFVFRYEAPADVVKKASRLLTLYIGLLPVLYFVFR